MRAKSSRIRTSSVKIIALCAFAAVAVRALCAAGLDEYTAKLFSKAAQNPQFVESAIASQLNIASAPLPTWADILQSQTVFHAPESTRDSAENAEFTASLIPWTLTSPKPSNPNEFPIKAISINPSSPSGYVNLGKIYLKNDSSKNIDLNSYLKADMPFSLKGDGPHVLIVHTHGSESYFPHGKYTYTPDDVERTSDKNYNVIRVGDEITKILQENGISVIHDRNIYDSPSYNGSYTRTLDAISAQMKKTPSIKVILDIHRDAMTTKEGVKYKTSATVNGQPSAQLMLVMSTGESGLPHPNWQENLKFAVKLQCQIANKYPGLMRPINLRKERFNMHVTTGSMLVEVGTSANSLQEALTAIRPFSQELAALLKSVKK